MDVLTVFNIFVACHKHQHFVVSEICKNFTEFVMGIYIISAKLLSEFATLEALVKKFKLLLTVGSLLLTVGSFAASHTLFITNFKIICVEFARIFFSSRECRSNSTLFCLKSEFRVATENIFANKFSKRKTLEIEYFQTSFKFKLAWKLSFHV